MKFELLLLIIILILGYSFQNEVSDTPNVSEEEITTLANFYYATGGPTWIWRKVNMSGPHWFSSHYVDPCYPKSWQGVGCSCNSTNCHVQFLHLSTYNLTGTVPSLTGLTQLTSLDLSSNFIEEFPYSLFDQVNLTYLDLGYNRFGGSIPNLVDQWINMVALRFAGNMLTGTIPSSFQSLTRLKDLDLSVNNITGQFDCLMTLTNLVNLFLSENRLTGEIPPSIEQLHNLNTLYIFGNYLEGTLIDQLWSLRNLTQLNVANNYLQGPLPDAVRNLTKLKVLDLSFNNFSGSFPSVLIEMSHTSSLVSIVYCGVGLVGDLDSILVNQSTSNLEILKVSLNYLTGTIPELDLKNLTFLAINNNFISGSIPASLCNSKGLRLLYMNNNQINGTLPNCIGNLSLFDMILSDNVLTGTLPDLLLTNSTLGGVYEVANNFFTGTIPRSICYASVHTLILANNALHGTIVDCLFNMTFLRSVNVSFNFFDGTVPGYLGRYNLMTSIALNHNKFTGTLPDMSDMFGLVYFYVQHNNLSGKLPFRTSTFNQTFRNLHESISFVDISNNEFTGTLSSQLFGEATSLLSFAAASNCFHGSIPEEICSAQGLFFLDLDGISTANSCRKYIFPGSKLLRSFTLINEMEGSIPSCLFDMPNLKTLHLSGNGIKGSFPDDLQLSDSLEYLDLSHNKLTGTIPKIIQRRRWEDIDLSYNKLVGILDDEIANSSTLTLQVNRISGSVPSILLNLKHINILTGNRFACGTFRSGLPVHDYAYDNFQCGSNSFNQAVVLWCCFAFVLIVFVALAAFPHRMWKDTLMMKLNQYYTLIKFHWYSVMDDKQFTSFSTFVRTMLRNNMICVAVIVFVIMPINLSASTNSKAQSNQYAWVVSAAYVSGFAPGLALTLVYMAFICLLFGMWWRMNDQRVKFDFAVLNKNYYSIGQSLSLSLVLVVNCTIMVLVNAGYVLAVLYQPAYIIALCQVSIAVFKLYWNDQVVRYLVRFSRRMYTPVLSPQSPSFLEVRSAQEMPFLTYMALFNCLIAPFLASAVVDTNCFREIFVPPEAVESTFPYYDCNVVQVQDGTCDADKDGASSITVSYDPPFIYSYQCTSSIMTNYASIYVFMYLFTIFIRPPMMYLAVRYYPYLPKGNWIHYWVDWLLNGILKPPNLDDIVMNRIIFRKERFILRYISASAVMVTFGVLFPPLAVVICGAYFTEALLQGSLIGRFLNSVTDPVTRGLFKDMLIIDSENCWGLFLNPMAHLVIPFASVFYGLIVIDIYGDSVGATQAIWMPALIVSTPVVLFCVRKVYLYRTTGSLWISDEQELVRHEVKESDVKSVSKVGSEQGSGDRRGSEKMPSMERKSALEAMEIENPIRKSGRDRRSLVENDDSQL